MELGIYKKAILFVLLIFSPKQDYLPGINYFLALLYCLYSMSLSANIFCVSWGFGFLLTAPNSKDFHPVSESIATTYIPAC